MMGENRLPMAVSVQGNESMPVSWRWSLAFVIGLVWTLTTNAVQAVEESVNRIHIKGSNAMIDVVQAWSKIYQVENPGVFFQIDGGGSGNGIAALINGHVDVAVTTRSLKPREARLIEQRFGALPKNFIIGQDALSIVVNKANPINGISMDQLAKLFGRHDSYTSWSDLGVTVPGCDGNVILRMSRKNNSGDYNYFRETILHDRGHFNSGLMTIRDAKKLLDRIAMAPCAIGFTSMATVTYEVKTICVARDDKKGTPCIPPTANFTHKGLYPLARPLYFYTLDQHTPLVQPFIDWVRGGRGQEILRKSGFIAIQESQSGDKDPVVMVPQKISVP